MRESGRSAMGPLDSRHRDINYDLCTALDLTRLGVVLDHLVTIGAMLPEEAHIYRVQVGCILTQLRRINDAKHSKPLSALLESPEKPKGPGVYSRSR